MGKVTRLHPPVWAQKVRGASAAMSLIRRELYEHDLHEVAEQVGVTYGCIVAIRSGRTMWPRHGTFFGLLEALNLQMILLKGGN